LASGAALAPTILQHCSPTTNKFLHLAITLYPGEIRWGRMTQFIRIILCVRGRVSVALHALAWREQKLKVRIKCTHLDLSLRPEIVGDAFPDRPKLEF
jgi:hypothetical protein